MCYALCIMKTREKVARVFTEQDEAWEQVAQSFRRACSLYHKGREDEAMSLAAEELTPLIGEWSRSSPLGGSAKRHRLISLFMEEGRRVGEMALLQKMLFAHMSAQAAVTRNARALFLGDSGLAGSISLSESKPQHASA